MSAGLFGLLDDIAALARLAAASVDDVGAAAGRASAKAAGVVVDDTAVTPQYVQNVAAKRELPIIWKIARGSLRNKLLFILPAALLLSQFLPWLLTPLLMCGGTYLCYEGAEKVWERLRGHEDHSPVATEDGELGAEHEASMVGGAIRTDFILSAEIMVIALNEVADEAFVPRAIILAVVAVGITALVYGVVAAIVKMDDIGLALSQRKSAARPAGRRRHGQVHADAAQRDLDRRCRGHALGRRPHHPQRCRRARLALALRPRPPLGGGRRRRARAPSAASPPGWSTPSRRRSSVSRSVRSPSLVMHFLPFGHKKDSAAAH